MGHCKADEKSSARQCLLLCAEGKNVFCLIKDAVQRRLLNFEVTVLFQKAVLYFLWNDLEESDGRNAGIFSSDHDKNCKQTVFCQEVSV